MAGHHGHNDTSVFNRCPHSPGSHQLSLRKCTQRLTSGPEQLVTLNIFVLNLLLQKCSFLPEKLIMEKLENNRLLIVDTFPISNYPSQLSTYSFRVQTQRNHIYSQKIRNRLGRPTFHLTSVKICMLRWTLTIRIARW